MITVSVQYCSKCKQLIVPSLATDAPVLLKVLSSPDFKCKACDPVEQANEISNIIKELNQNRSRALDLFTQAFIAVNAPANFDYAWVVNNVVLCHRTIYENGVMTDQHWLELSKPGVSRGAKLSEPKNGLGLS